jgi:hypothetical protein
MARLLRTPAADRLPRILRPHRHLLNAFSLQLEMLDTDDFWEHATLAQENEDDTAVIAHVLEELLARTGDKIRDLKNARVTPYGTAAEDSERGSLLEADTASELAAPSELRAPSTTSVPRSLKLLPAPQMGQRQPARAMGTVGDGSMVSMESVRKALDSIHKTLPTFKKGMHFPTWLGDAQLALDLYGRELAPDHKYLALRKALSDDVAKDLEMRTELSSSRSPDALLSALMELYQPQTLECSHAIAAAKQQPSQSAARFFYHLRSIYERYNCAYPTGDRDLTPLVYKFTDPHLKFIDQKWLVLAGHKQRGALTLNDLKVACEYADTKVGDARAATLRPRDKTTKAGTADVNATEPTDDKRQHNGSGGKYKGNFQRGGYKGNQPRNNKSPEQFTRGRPQGNPVNATQAGDSDSSEELELVPLTLAINAHGRQGRGRPRAAEATIAEQPPQQRNQPPAAAPQDTAVQLQRNMQRQFGLGGVTPADRLTNSMVSMTWGQLVTLTCSEKWQAAAGQLRQFFTDGQNVAVNATDAVIAALLDQVGLAPQSSSAGVKQPARKRVSFAGAAEPAGDGGAPPPLDGRQQQPLRMVDGAAVIGAHSVHLLPVAATDYKAALMSNKPTIDHYLVSMPQIKFQFIGGSSAGAGGAGGAGGGDRVASIDSGAVMCCISEKAYRRDKDHLGGTLGKLTTPLAIKTFNNQVTATDTILMGAKIVIGRAVYPMNFVLVPGASYEYLLGANFMAEYDITLGFRSCAAYIGVTEEQLLPGHKMPMKGRQRVPLYYRGRVVTWSLAARA